MTEQRRPDVQPAEPRPAAKELLDLENYGAVYGRLLYATQLSVEKGLKHLDPEFVVPETPSPFFDKTKVRDYNPFVEPLSTDERKKAWDGRDLNEAYAEWRPQFTTAVKNTDRDNRKAVIKALTGKEAANITEADVDTMYNKYCRGKSDITAYVNDVVTGFTTNGTVNEEEIKDKIDEVQWFASKFFGSKSSEITVIIANLEVLVKTQQTETIAKFYTTSGLNDLKEPGSKLLETVFQRFKPETPAAATTSAGPAPATATPTQTGQEPIIDDEDWKAGFQGTQPESDDDEEKDEDKKKDDVPIAPPAPDVAARTSAAQPVATEPAASGETKPKENLPHITETLNNPDGVERQLEEIIEEKPDAQNIHIGMHINTLSQFLSLILKDKLKDENKPGTVDFVGIDNKELIIRGVETKDGKILKFSVRNSEDGKGIELGELEGGPGDDVKEALKNFTSESIRYLNERVHSRRPKLETYRFHLEGKGEDAAIVIEVVPKDPTTLRPDAASIPDPIPVEPVIVNQPTEDTTI